MAQLIEGRKVRVKPSHSNIKFRGDVGSVMGFDPAQGYLVKLEENGYKFVQYCHLEDAVILEQRR